MNSGTTVYSNWCAAELTRPSQLQCPLETPPSRRSLARERALPEQAHTHYGGEAAVLVWVERRMREMRTLAKACLLSQNHSLRHGTTASMKFPNSKRDTKMTPSWLDLLHESHT